MIIIIVIIIDNIKEVGARTSLLVHVIHCLWNVMALSRVENFDFFSKYSHTHLQHDLSRIGYKNIEN